MDNIEARARELLAAEYAKAGYHSNAAAIRQNQPMSDERIALRALSTALTSSRADAFCPRDCIDEIRAAIADPGKLGGFRGQLSLPSWQAEAVVLALEEALSTPQEQA